MNPAKIILVVEDEPMLQQNIVAILELHGFKTLTASSGAEGLLVAKNNFVDIILSDMMMENMNGLELLKEIKAINSTKTIPFIFLTAFADNTDKTNGLQAGADAYITKPFNIKELIQTIKRFI